MIPDDARKGQVLQLGTFEGWFTDSVEATHRKTVTIQVVAIHGNSAPAFALRDLLELRGNG